MSIKPEGERVRMAVRWISEHLKADATRAIMPLVHEATTKFDLTPKEGEELIQFYRSAQQRESDSSS
jgi:hypothetical protein